MMLQYGDLIVTKDVSNRHTIVFSIVIDKDIGSNNCHIRNVMSINTRGKSALMNWQNIKKTKIIGKVKNIGQNEDYATSIVDLNEFRDDITDYVKTNYPEYTI